MTLSHWLTQTSNGHRTEAMALIRYTFALSAIIICSYLLYQQGWSAPWLFDDKFSLAGLAEVSNLPSALSFITANNTGPTGRPVAMLSFLANVTDWDMHAAGFRQFNTILHLLNTLFIAVIAWRIAQAAPGWNPRALGIAVTFAAVWSLHPLFASTVLSAVQRMTLLSGFFVLLGVLGYLIGRELLERQQRAGILTILISVGLCTLLAGFSKETGFLLPAYVGLIELILLNRWRPVRQTYWIPLFLGMLLVPILASAGYAILNWSAMEQTIEIHRDYNIQQRLWSECVILWDYVRQLLVPDIRLMGPFQDDPGRLHSFGLLPLIALSGWLIALGAAIRFRRQFPIILFGLGVFLVGHWLESTIIPLELYFEHRNYLPALGILVIPVVGIWSLKALWIRLVASIGLAAMMGILLWLTLRGWASDEIGAERWYRAHPNSLRAMIHKAQWVEQYQGIGAAAAFTLQAADQRPDDPAFAAYALAAQCSLPKSIYGPSLLGQIDEILRNRERTPPAVLNYLEHALAQRLRGYCYSVPLDAFTRVFQQLLDASPLALDATMQARLRVALGMIAMHQGDVGAGLTSVLEGFRLHRTYQTYGLLVEKLIRYGREEDARQLTDEFIAYQPANIFTKAEHQRRVREAYVEAEQKAAAQP